MSDVVKIMAKAICQADGGESGVGITCDLAEPVTNWNWERYIPKAQAALDALAAAGYGVTRATATDAMKDAGADACNYLIEPETAGEIHSAMLAASGK